MFYEICETGLRLVVKVTPKASSNKIQVREGALKIYVTAVPEDGKANKAVIQLLSKALHVPKTTIKVVQGETSRTKTLMIEGNGRDLIKRIEGAIIS